MKINDEKLQEKLGWTPHAGQREILENKSREILLCCGRRYGKSLTCAYEVVRTALLPNKRIWIAAPNYELSKIVFDQAMIWLAKILPPAKFKVQQKPFPVIKIANGTIIEGKSCEAKAGMLGRSTDLVVVDEAALVDENIWTQHIKPTTHERKGKVLYISTPRGLNWFYDKSLELGKNAYHFKSLDNPYFPFPGATEEERQEEWEKIKQSVPENVFRQEYEAEFLTEAGLVFRGVEDIIEDTLAEPEPTGSYIMGVDIARHDDFTAICVIDRATRKVVYLDRFRDIDYPVQKEKILLVSRKYNNAQIIIDSTGMGDSVASDLKRFAFVEEYPLYSHQKKMQLIDKLIIYINEKVIRIPNQQNLVEELKKYEVTVLEKSKKYHYSAPKGKHDDLVIATALAVWGLTPVPINEEPEVDSIREFREYE